MPQPNLTSLIATCLVVALGAPVTAVAAGEADVAALAAELEATEQAFAQTMADRDHDGFVSFLADEAVFFGRQGEIRGREAVAAAWKPLYEAREAPFSWQPESATVLDSGTLGLTSGPIFDPEGKRIGTFNSVWRRSADGSWKVVFDRACPDCECPPAAAADP